MSTAAPARLVCPECGRENEPERLYCHDCGARLDHSQLRPRLETAPETQAEVHKRVTSMFDGRRGRTRALFLKCLKLVAAAGLAAMVVLILLPPPALPPATKSEVLPPQISLDLEGMTQFQRPPQLRYSQADANAYLAYVLGKKKETLDHLLLDFERAVVAFSPQKCELTVGRSIFGYPIYNSGSFAVQLQSGQLRVTPLSGAIGRLPIHPVLMRYSNFLFGDVVGALDRERKLMAKVGSVELGEKEIMFGK